MQSTTLVQHYVFDQDSVGISLIAYRHPKPRELKFMMTSNNCSPADERSIPQPIGVGG